MECLPPHSGQQLVPRRHLSRLYNDTKKSGEFVNESPRTVSDPGAKVLNRKLRIQVDRLTSWGFEWSNPSQLDEIDEPLSRAGLSEAVGNIMSTTQSILAEAEPLWSSLQGTIEGKRPLPEKKRPDVQWDKARLEDLVRDLTMSIDTLHNLSRNCIAGVRDRDLSKSSSQPTISEDHQAFESSRLQAPRQIDANFLSAARDPAQDEDAAPLEGIILMSKAAYSSLSCETVHEAWSPILIEYAYFDTIYTDTGITPPMFRFERLSNGLQQEPRRSASSWVGLPRLLAYFQDPDNSRMALVYALPALDNCDVFSYKNANSSSQCGLISLNTLLSRPNSAPTLEARFRLAANLTRTVFDMHARGISHGRLSADNVTFYDGSSGGKDLTNKTIDVRHPLVSAFDLFQEEAPDSSSPGNQISDSRSSSKASSKNLVQECSDDIRNLGKLLISIGLWVQPEELHLNAEASVTSELFDVLAVRCGGLFSKAAQACWNVSVPTPGLVDLEHTLRSAKAKVSCNLEACCVLDVLSGLDDQPAPETRQRLPLETGHDAAPFEDLHPAPPLPDSRTAAPLPEFSDVATLQESPITELEGFRVNDDHVRTREHNNESNEEGQHFSPVYPNRQPVLCPSGPLAEEPELPRVKQRLYPHVPLQPDVIEKWHSILMPQVNQALRQFYRKNPESVEISLVSVGPSPTRTQPTVLVVCTSVGKVRAILRKRLGDFFDGTTGFGLKVCRGHVLRSCERSNIQSKSSLTPNDQDLSKGSPSTEQDVPQGSYAIYQTQPGNGISIGAWVGGRHLCPVSFGGLIMIDDRPYGMTVHHMLDDPELDPEPLKDRRSSAAKTSECRDGTNQGVFDIDRSLNISDTDSDSSYSSEDESDSYDEVRDELEVMSEAEDGDIPGVNPDDPCNDLIVTQPAFLDSTDDKIDQPYSENDHLERCKLGRVFASSGIRRKKFGGLLHEVDWALFDFAEGRLPKENAIPCDRDGKLPLSLKHHDLGRLSTLCPTSVAPSSSLFGKNVLCMARTSGLQHGRILPTLSSVKMCGRTSASQAFQVASTGPTPEEASRDGQGLALGIPGDSGAWIVDQQCGELCGHVLAWSDRKSVAYICPMDILIRDMAETLQTTRIRLPVREAVAEPGSKEAHSLGRCTAEDERNPELHNSIGENETALSLERPGEPGAVSSALKTNVENSINNIRRRELGNLGTIVSAHCDSRQRDMTMGEGRTVGVTQG